jgi:mercuric ion binding protein
MRKTLIVTALLIAMAGTAYAETIKATVNGLVCSFCARGIEKTFKKQAAVEDVKVDLDAKLVTIHIKKDQAMDDKTVTSLIQDAGYSVTNIKREK